ncbi:HD domain-containing protein [Streptococcus caprae]|uniref:5'-deoxynucleotidase n=1 Tax=Streptococcus caprae TaxID=1640501 RepID=A0ABV8CVF6_9STRE
MKHLTQQLAFFKELELLKTVTRQNQTMDGRYENSAEHSWQLAVMAMTLRDYFPEKINLEHVLSMLLLHDIGEIGVGDTSAFDEVGKQTSYERELKSVTATFGHLPQAQAQYYLGLWKEFEQGRSPEARFARCMDALAPLMNHLWIAAEGENSDELTKSQVLAKKSFIEKESPELWQLTQDLLDQSVAKGLYLDK